MIKLDKLNSLLILKDMDVSRLTNILSEHRNSLIKLALMIGSLLMIGLMFNDTHVKEQALRVRMSQARQKMEIINSRDAVIQDINNFKSSLPKKLNEFELITLISNDAKLHYVAITSLSPAESKDMGLYDLINVSFEAVSDNFKETMVFLRNIERSDFPLRIDSWSGHEANNEKMTFSIRISAVLVHT